MRKIRNILRICAAILGGGSKVIMTEYKLVVVGGKLVEKHDFFYLRVGCSTVV